MSYGGYDEGDRPPIQLNPRLVIAALIAHYEEFRSLVRTRASEYETTLDRPDELAELFRRSDFITLHVPENDQTRGMVNAAFLAKMKPGSTLVNSARGGLVVEKDLIAALRSGHLRGAALDVFEEEPLPESSPLWALDNILISAHTADHTKTWLNAAVVFFMEQFARWRSGKPLKNIVDKRAGY